MVGERRIVSSESQDQAADSTPPALVEDCFADVKSRFVKWPWNDNVDLYRWKMPGVNVNPPKKWPYNAKWWTITINFFKQQKWAQFDSYQMSIYEVAFHFWKSVKMVSPECAKGNPDFFLLIVRWIRMVIRECKKLKVHLWPEGTM